MGRKVAVTFDEHDLEQIETLAKVAEIRVQEQIRRMCRAQLDRTTWSHEKASGQ